MNAHQGKRSKKLAKHYERQFEVTKQNKARRKATRIRRAALWKSKGATGINASHAAGIVRRRAARLKRKTYRQAKETAKTAWHFNGNILIFMFTKFLVFGTTVLLYSRGVTQIMSKDAEIVRRVRDYLNAEGYTRIDLWRKASKLLNPATYSCFQSNCELLTFTTLPLAEGMET